MAGEDLIEVKFRLPDGADIGPRMYGPSTTIAALKENVIELWPKDKENGPKSIYDLTLIAAGKIMEDHSTLTEAQLPGGEFRGSMITMHVVLRPPMSDKERDKLQNHSAKLGRGCECSIM